MSRSITKQAGVALGICLSLLTAVHADAGLQLAGFGTVSAYRGDDPAVMVKASDRTARGSRDGEWRWDGDSVLGLQLQWNAHSDVELVWQLQSRDDLIKRFRPITEWAYVGWRPHPSWTLRLGRQPLPVFLHSESSRIGFARTSVRPMPAVYGLNSSEPTDALNVTWGSALLGGDISLDLGAGGNKVDLPRGRVHTKLSTVSALRWHRDGLSLRLGAAAFHFDLRESVLAGQIAALGQAGSLCGNCSQVLADRARMNGVRGQLFNLGLVWEREGWSLSAEAMQRDGNSVFSSKASAWYAQLSKRLGSLTPYAAIGESRFREVPLGLRAVPGAPAAAVAALDQFDRILQSPFDRRILQTGMRWDIHEQMALKLQYERWTATRDRFTPRSGQLTLPPATPGSMAWDGSVSLLTLALDFVF